MLLTGAKIFLSIIFPYRLSFERGRKISVCNAKKSVSAKIETAKGGKNGRPKSSGGKWKKNNNG